MPEPTTYLGKRASLRVWRKFFGLTNTASTQSGLPRISRRGGGNGRILGHHESQTDCAEYSKQDNRSLRLRVQSFSGNGWVLCHCYRRRQCYRTAYSVVMDWREWSYFL